VNGPLLMCCSRSIRFASWNQTIAFWTQTCTLKSGARIDRVQLGDDAVDGNSCICLQLILAYDACSGVFVREAAMGVATGCVYYIVRLYIKGRGLYKRRGGEGKSGSWFYNTWVSLCLCSSCLML